MKMLRSSSNEKLEPKVTKLYPLLHNSKRINEDAKESQLLLWFFNIFQEISPLSYESFIRDGVMLCRLMNILKPGSVSEPITSGENFNHKRNNVKKFLKACKEYGVAQEKLFEVDELILLENIPRITRCLFELGRLADNDPNFKGTKLGEMPRDPIDFRAKRRNGMPEGDDLHVAHVNINRLKRMMSL